MGGASHYDEGDDYDSPTGVTLGTPIQFPGGGTEYVWTTSFGGVSSLTKTYSGSLTFGTCTVNVDWSSMYLGGEEEDSSLFNWFLEAFQTTVDYSYDPLNRLTNISYDNRPRYEYGYDNVGNRTSQQVCASENCIDMVEYSYSYRCTNLDLIHPSTWRGLPWNAGSFPRNTNSPISACVSPPTPNHLW